MNSERQSTGPADPVRSGRRATVSAATLLVVAAVGAVLTGESAVAAPSPAVAHISANGSSREPSISRDGRYVAFYSFATNLVAGDTNRAADVFVRDLVVGTTRRVSVGSTGRQGDDSSLSPSISDDGRYVAFYSVATNLVARDTNRAEDVFVRDLALGTTRRVSVSDSGAQANGFSANVSISNDGTVVGFTSAASNLVAGDTNAKADVFVRNLRLGTTRRVSVGAGGRQANDTSGDAVVSGDGRHVAFLSSATNLDPRYATLLPDIFVRDLVQGSTRLVSLGSTGAPIRFGTSAPSISDDGRCVTFVAGDADVVPGDTNDRDDAFLRDLVRGTTERVTFTFSGGQILDNFTFDPEVSGDCRYVAFESSASNVVEGDPGAPGDVFIRDRVLGTNRAVSEASGTHPSGDFSAEPSISGDNSQVAFASFAADLVDGDTNDQADVFVRDLRTGTIRLVTVGCPVC